MKNILTGFFIFIASTVRYLITETYFETTVMIMIIGIFFIAIGILQLQKEKDNEQD